MAQIQYLVCYSCGLSCDATGADGCRGKNGQGCTDQHCHNNLRWPGVRYVLCKPCEERMIQELERQFSQPKLLPVRTNTG